MQKYAFPDPRAQPSDDLSSRSKNQGTLETEKFEKSMGSPERKSESSYKVPPSFYSLNVQKADNNLTESGGGTTQRQLNEMWLNIAKHKPYSPSKGSMIQSEYKNKAVQSGALKSSHFSHSRRSPKLSVYSDELKNLEKAIFSEQFQPDFSHIPSNFAIEQSQANLQATLKVLEETSHSIEIAQSLPSISHHYFSSDIQSSGGQTFTLLDIETLNSPLGCSQIELPQALLSPPLESDYSSKQQRLHSKNLSISSIPHSVQITHSPVQHTSSQSQKRHKEQSRNDAQKIGREESQNSNECPSEQPFDYEALEYHRYFDLQRHQIETIQEGTEELNETNELRRQVTFSKKIESSSYGTTNQMLFSQKYDEGNIDEQDIVIKAPSMEVQYKSSPPEKQSSTHGVEVSEENKSPYSGSVKAGGRAEVTRRGPQQWNVRDQPPRVNSDDDDDLADIHDSDQEASPIQVAGSPQRFAEQQVVSSPIAVGNEADARTAQQDYYQVDYPYQGDPDQLPYAKGYYTQPRQYPYANLKEDQNYGSVAYSSASPDYQNKNSGTRSVERLNKAKTSGTKPKKNQWKGRTQSLMDGSNVHDRLFEHSKQLNEKRHLKKLTQHIYDETSQLKEVKQRPTVNANCNKMSKRKEMYRLGSEPIQNALYRDFIYREKRKQEGLHQKHQQVQADLNKQKTNSKSYKLALRKLEKDLHDVFRECSLDPAGSLTFQDMALIVAKLNIFKIHGNLQGTRKFQTKVRTLAESLPSEALKEHLEEVEGGNQQIGSLIELAVSYDKRSAANSVLQLEQRKEREEELHLQLWKYLNQFDSDKIDSLVLMEFFKVILCQFTQNVKELANTVNDLMAIARHGNPQELIDRDFEEREGPESAPHYSPPAENFPHQQGYPQEPATESESNESGRAPVQNYSRRSMNEVPNGPNIQGQNLTPLESPPENQEMPNNVVRGRLSGIPEENMTSVRQQSMMQQDVSPLDEGAYMNQAQRISTDQIPSWSIEDILREIKALNDGTLIFKRPGKKLTTGRESVTTETDFQREPEQYTFQPRINAKSKTVKSKFMEERKLEEYEPEKPKKEGSKRDDSAMKKAQESHKRLIEAKSEYEKKNQMRQEQKAKKEMEKCTFKPTINEKSKNLESRFKNGGAPTPEKPKDQKAAVFNSGGVISAADLLGAKRVDTTTSPKKRKPPGEELPQVGEYLQCTFKPEIIGTNFNKQIFQKKKDVKGVDDAAKRMREAHQNREKIKNYMESLKLGTQYEKNKQKKFHVPQLKTMERANKSQQAPILLLDVNVGPGKTGRLVVHKGQELETAANEFAQIYHLNDFMKKNLMKMLQVQYEEYLKEQEQLAHSDFSCSFEQPSSEASPLVPPKEERKSSIQISKSPDLGLISSQSFKQGSPSKETEVTLQLESTAAISNKDVFEQDP